MLESDLRQPHDYLIAQCNNCFLYFEHMEDLVLSPLKDLCSEEEIEVHYS